MLGAHGGNTGQIRLTAAFHSQNDVVPVGHVAGKRQVGRGLIPQPIVVPELVATDRLEAQVVVPGVVVTPPFPPLVVVPLVSQVQLVVSVWSVIVEVDD